MNSSEALKARREAERAERRRNERLQERADEQAEREREEARAEERRREGARDEAAARVAEDRARERRQEQLLQLRQARVVSARQDRKRGARRLLARRELEDTRRAEVARERAGEQRRTDAAEQAATAQRVEQRETEARTKRLDEQRVERQAAEGEQAAAAERQAELRKSDTERRASERQGKQADAERREHHLEEQRRRLREERRGLEQRSGETERLRVEAAARAQEARRRDQVAADRRAELQRAARKARLQELAAARAAAEAATERAAELRAQAAARRLSERREPAARSERRAGLEATELPWLRTEEGELVAWGGERVLLRGVAARGLDEAVAAGSPMREALALDDPNLEQLSERWGANVVRLPFGAETIPGADLTELDELIGALTAASIYTLLALEPPEAGGQTPLPGAETHRAWRLLADRYQAESGVLFELYSAAAPLAAGWPAAALALVRTIRSRHQSSLLLLPEAGGELGAVHNLVYTIRLAPGSPARLDERLTALATREAVLVSDWREDGLDPAGPATATAGLLERHQLSWCAGYWNAHPRLVADAAASRLTETRFGLAVRRALAAPGPPSLRPF